MKKLNFMLAMIALALVVLAVNGQAQETKVTELGEINGQQVYKFDGPEAGHIVFGADQEAGKLHAIHMDGQGDTPKILDFGMQHIDYEKLRKMPTATPAQRQDFFDKSAKMATPAKPAVPRAMVAQARAGTLYDTAGRVVIPTVNESGAPIYLTAGDNPGEWFQVNPNYLAPGAAILAQSSVAVVAPAGVLENSVTITRTVQPTAFIDLSTLEQFARGQFPELSTFEGRLVFSLDSNGLRISGQETRTATVSDAAALDMINIVRNETNF